MPESELRLLWENRENGAYLTVPAEAPPEFFKVESILRSLIEDNVLNFNRERIREILENPSGRPELVGPPFVRFDEAKRPYIQIKAQPVEAFFLLKSSILASTVRITRADMEFLLAESHVIHGLCWDAVQGILDGKLYDEDVVVAKADLPVAGRDAEIQEVVPIDPDARPVLLEDGSVDYRNLDNIRQITEDALIAEKVPATPGIAGKDIFGRLIPAEYGKDIPMPIGENTRCSPEGLRLFAAASGYLYRKFGKICVGRLFVVKEDVSFKTGNIDYCGDVLVRGNVLSDFKVLADGNITIEGLVEGAELRSRQGGILVRNGVFGRSKAVLEAAQDISVGMAQEAFFKTPMTVKVHKYMRSCRVEAGLVKADASGCVVTGCDILLVSQAHFNQLGAVGGGVNRIRLSQQASVDLHEKIEELDVLVGKMAQVLQGFEAKLTLIKSQLKNPELGNSELRAEYQNWHGQYQLARKKAELVQERRRKMLQQLDVPPDRPEIILAKRLEPVLEVSFHGEERAYRQAVSNVSFGWKNGNISVEAR